MSVVATGTEISEEEIIALIRGAQRNDRQAFDRIYALYADRIFRYLYYRLPDRQEAEDLTADVFVRLLEKLDTYRLGQSDQVAVFSGWLFRIAHNLLIDHFRKRGQRRQEPLEKAPLFDHRTPESDVETALEWERLRNALARLTDDQQQVIVLRFLEGMRMKEVARIMEKSEGAVKALQHRALSALQRQLGS
jgi:RNA polymerase sigma-70 factor (ECF subfamily)